LTQPDNIQIAPAEGKLGVLIPGMGAVTTTFLAGLEAIKRGLGKPVGSLTQLGTVRLGKRTEGRSPAIKDFIPLANLEDLVVGTWDIFEDNAYEAAVNAGVLDMPLLEQLKEPLAALKPMKAVFDQNFVKRINGLNVMTHGSKMDYAERVMDEVQGKDWRFATDDDLVRIHRGLSRTRTCARYPEGLRMRAAEERP
jgi:myo-inositol-1-phosphate synthase